jgi:broad specificity phosphatase PhoE
MTKIYFVRHCEAEGNVKRIFQGLTDLDISELGAKQLKLLEKRFENIPLDKI